MVTVVLENIRRFAFNIKNGFVFYFDNTGMVRAFPCDDRSKYPNILGINTRIDGSLFIDPWDIYWRIEAPDDRIKAMAISRIKVGDDYKLLEHYLNTLKPAEPGTRKSKGLDRFICRIYPPEIYRLPENTNKKTFDFIIMEVSILSEEAIPNRNEYLKQNIVEISSRVTRKLQCSKSFIKYGVPVNYMKITSVTLNKKSGILKFQYELKDLPEEVE